MKLALRIGLAVLIAAGVLFLSDRVLAWLGLPREVGLYSHPPNLVAVRKNLEFSYCFTTNSQGLRSKEIPLDKPEGVYRVYLAGDSFVEGWGVDDGDTFCSLLEEKIAGVDFINGGLGGTGPLKYGRTFVNIGLKYHPDALLICYSANDLGDTAPDDSPTGFYSARPAGIKGAVSSLFPRIYRILRNLYHGYRFRARTTTKDLVGTIARVARNRGISDKRIKDWSERLPEELVTAADRGEFNGAVLSTGLLCPFYWSDSLDISSAGAEARWQAVVKILAALRSLSREEEIPMALVFLPAHLQCNPDLYRGKNSNIWEITGTTVRDDWIKGKSEIQRRLEMWTASRNIPFLDLTETFRSAINQGRTLYYPLDGHWNREGHRLAAETIGDWLREEEAFGFIPAASNRANAAGERPN